MGYHLKEITKGKIGELSKVREELDEAFDAKAQGCEVMVLLELSDMIGAVKAYLEARHPSMTLGDLITMSDITRRAFKDGTRKSREEDLPRLGKCLSCGYEACGPYWCTICGAT